MKTLLITLFLAFSATSFGFEGIIHCTKTQNGVTTSFDFYVKNDKIAVISESPEGNYRLLLDRGAGQMKLCIDDPRFDRKGYYLYTASTMEKKDALTILKQTKTDAIDIDGEKCEGYTVVTDNGSAIAYFGSDEVNLTGFSAYMNDPVYELLDALKSSKLPRKLIVNKGTGSYTIDLTAEATTLDASLFEVPAGYEQFEVKVEGVE